MSIESAHASLRSAPQTVDFSKKIKGKITPLLRHLASVPALSEDELNKLSEAIKPRKAIEDSNSSEAVSTDASPSDESQSAADVPTEASNDDSDEPSDMVELPMQESRSHGDLIANYVL